MGPKLTGHALQLAGYGLTFLGLAVPAAALFLAGRDPAGPFWGVVLAGVAGGAVLMVVGGRVNTVGRGLVLGSPERAERDDRRATQLLAAYLAVVLLQGAWVAAPLFLPVVGLAPPGNSFTVAWLVTWQMVFCVGRYWITRPLVRAADRWLGGPGTSGSPAGCGRRPRRIGRAGTRTACPG